MDNNVLNSDIRLVGGKNSRHLEYELKVRNKTNDNIVTVRKSKKGGSTYSNALLDLIYMIGKFDPYFWDKLVADKDFPKMIEQMQDAYARKANGGGWSPEQVKELEEYKKKLKSLALKKLLLY